MKGRKGIFECILLKMIMPRSRVESGVCVFFVFSEQSLVDFTIAFLGILDWWGLWGIPKIKQFVYKSNRFQNCVKTLIISK